MYNCFWVAATLLALWLEAAPVCAQEVPAAASIAIVSGRQVPDALRHRLVEVINLDRAAAGLAPVSFSAALSAAADAHCTEMLREGYTSHWNRDGWKPYLRYAQLGIRDYTSENIWGVVQTGFGVSAEEVRAELERGHRNFMSEVPPNDGHRQSILGRHHQTAGIGIAYNATGLRMIELFASRRADLDDLPRRANRRDTLAVRGRLPTGGWDLFAIAVYYEPPPLPHSLLELQATGSYGLPEEQMTERPLLSGRYYTDGTQGTVNINVMREFTSPLRFWKNRPGVYTVVVWVREGSAKPVVGAMASLLVEE